MAWSSLGRRMVLRGLLAETPEPTGGNRRSGDGSRGELRRRQVRAGGGDEAAGVGPGLDAPLAAGGDDAEAGGVEPAAFIGSGPEADAPGDHGVAQRALGLVVGRRQIRVRDEGDDRVPVVEDFTGQVANLLLDVVAVALAAPLDAGHQALDGLCFRIAVVDPLDEPPQVTHEVTTEAGAVAVIALGERQTLADEMGQTALAAGMIAIGYVAVGHQPAQESLANQRGEFLLAAAADVIDGRRRRHRHPHPAQDAPLIPGGLVEVDDLRGLYVLDELLDHGFAGQAEFVDAALDGRRSKLEGQPVAQEFLDLAPREAEAQRQRRDESGEHRAHQAALVHMQVPPAALDLRAESDAWAGQGLMTTAAADREVDVFGRGDLKRHVAAHEFEAVVGADAPSLQVGTEAGAAGRAHRRWVLDVRAHYDRLAAPMPFRAGLFACGPAGLHLVQFASALGRGGGSLGVVSAVRATGRRLASLATPIGVVTRRRPRTGRRVLARAVGQRTRQLVQPPRQLLELLARHRREVCPLHIVQVGVESVRHARRRILFASIRKPAARLSDDDRIRLIAPVRTRGGVNGYRHGPADR